MRRFIKHVVEVLDGAPPPTRRGQRGQSLVEMTLIMPILLIILLGVIEMGWFAQNILTLTEAGRVGARRAPFLNGNFSPLAWNEAATYPPPDTALDTDPRVRVRGGIAPDADCTEVEPNDSGFFNLIVCATISAMDPLVLNQTNEKDDIVVSAFALQRVTIGATSNDDINPSALGSSSAYGNGTQLVVVGRYPYTANECYLWGERDPFDWITNGTVDYTTNPVLLPFEIAVWDPVASEYVGFADNTVDERMVGFSWLGQWRYVDDSGARTDCYGSQWKIEEVQERANLDGFLTSEADRQYLPSVGLVLVEIFWEHTLIFENFPAMSAEWSPVYQLLGGSDPNTVNDVIRTWAMFPAPGAEPRLVFK
ncbi:MAG: pilus assembly protein [Anaerolineae bacterium]|nr:pilus assembly protein [Anaerolineae bacterium]